MSTDERAHQGLAVGPDRGRTGPALPVLTDEELLALGGTAGGGELVLAPYLDGLDAASRDIAQCVALRSLLARGVVSRLTAHPDGVTAQLAPEVDRLLLVRARAETVVAIRRCVGLGLAAGAAQGSSAGASLTYRHLHVAGSDVLIEDVDPAGLHRFVFLAAEDVLPSLQSFLVPAGAVPGVRAIAAREALDLLAGAHVVADVVIRRLGRLAEPAVMRQLYLGPTGCYTDLDSGGSGSSGVRRKPGELMLGPIAPADVAAWVLALTPMRGCLA